MRQLSTATISISTIGLEERLAYFVTLVISVYSSSKTHCTSSLRQPCVLCVVPITRKGKVLRIDTKTFLKPKGQRLRSQNHIMLKQQMCQTWRIDSHTIFKLFDNIVFTKCHLCISFTVERSKFKVTISVYFVHLSKMKWVTENVFTDYSRQMQLEIPHRLLCQHIDLQCESKK